jgi:hypothetical protein
MTNDLKKTHYVEADDVYITPKGRGNFVFLHAKFLKKGGQGDPKYVVSMILPPDADLKLLDKAAKEAAKAEGWDVPTFLDGEVKIKKDKKTLVIASPFIAADEKLADVTSKGEEVDLEGWKMLRCSSKRRPNVRDNKGELIDLDDLEEAAYSGRWLRLMVRPYAYGPIEGNQGVAFGLEGAQLLGHDDKLGGAPASPTGDAFSAVDDDEDDDV